MPETLILVDVRERSQSGFFDLEWHLPCDRFFGATQNPPKAATTQTTAHKFRRVEFMKIEGSGKDALDFHIAFHLGRVFETARDTLCVILSKDKGYDPLLLHLNKNGLACCRVTSLEELLPAEIEDPERVVCQRCKKADNSELHGGRWCANCGSFAAPQDPKPLPSLQAGFEAPQDRPFFGVSTHQQHRESTLQCGWWHQRMDCSDGIYDDGEWMCFGCM